MAVVLRFVDSDFCIQQRLVRMQLLEKSMTREEIAHELINTLSVQYSVKPDLLLTAMHDRASTNNVALRTLKVVYPKVVDVGCISHTLDLVGEKFTTPHLNEFSAQAVIRSITSNATQQQQLMEYAAACVQPGLQYFADCKANSMKGPSACFKSARLVSPTKIEEMKPSTSEVDTLVAFPFLSGGLDALKTEIPAYLAAVEDIWPDYDPL